MHKMARAATVTNNFTKLHQTAGHYRSQHGHIPSNIMAKATQSSRTVAALLLLLLCASPAVVQARMLTTQAPYLSGPQVSGRLRTSQAPYVKFLSVKCVRPAVGMDPWVDDVIGTVVSAAAMDGAKSAGILTAPATGGASAVVVAAFSMSWCQSTRGPECQSTSGASGVGFAISKGTGELVQLVDRHFSGTDDLYVKVNNNKVWPPAEFISTASQQTHTINMDFQTPATFDLVEWDNPVFWDDNTHDAMGGVRIEPNHPIGKWISIVAHPTEGSVYEVRYQVYYPASPPPAYVPPPVTNLGNGRPCSTSRQCTSRCCSYTVGSANTCEDDAWWRRCT